MLDRDMSGNVLKEKLSRSTQAAGQLVYILLQKNKGVPVSVNHPGGRFFRTAKVANLDDVVKECCDLIEEHGDANVKIKVHYD
jgi:hypothetical protein